MRIDIQNHPEFSKWLGAGLQRTAVKALHSTALRIVQEATTVVIPQTLPFQPVDRGLYRAGFRVEIAPGVIFIVNTTKQAPMIEWGVRAENVKPGRAMIDALAGWVKRKGLLNPRGSDGKKPPPPPEKQLVSVAWAIAKSMQKQGIFGGSANPAGYRVLERAMTKFDSFFQKEFARELKGNLK